MIVYVVEAQGPSQKNLMLYGHLDKQPWMLPWKKGLGPTTPVIAGDYLYGRGGADDGYSPFSCMLAIASLQSQKTPHPRCVLVLETEEESGSPNLLELLEASKGVIGNPDVMICMDSGAFDYSRLWLTSSLRGVVSVDLTVSGATQCYHSGEVGGIIPETFSVVRALLDRVDDSKTGEICKELRVETPIEKLKEAREISNLSGDQMWKKYSMHDGVKAMK
jgi:acetylornithine deacetylase/succinyl-diaminopimelate desuccinylase-like protein